MTRIVKAEEKTSKILLKGHSSTLSLSKSSSIIDENASENLIEQGLDVIFKELNRYLAFTESFQGIEWDRVVGTPL